MRALQRPKRVPEGEDGFEDLLREQAQFFSEKAEPAAKVVKPKVSRFKQMQEEMRQREQELQEDKKEPEIAELGEMDETGPGVSETVTEHTFTEIPPIIATACSAQRGFPSAKNLLPSLRAKRIAQVPTPARNPNVPEANGIDEENIALLRDMNGHDVKEHIDSIHASLGDRLATFLQKRGEAKIKSEMPQNSSGDTVAHHPSSGSRSGVDPPPLEAVTKKVHFDEKSIEVARTYRAEEATEKPIEMSISESERKKMEWMEPVLPCMDEEVDGTSVQRFDFDGKLLAHDEEGTYPALYHHGEDPHRAGYAAHELLLLARSSDLSQRATALKIIENIVRRYPEDAPTNLAQLPELLYWLLLQRRRPSIYLAALRIVAALENTHPDGRLDLLDVVEDSREILLPRIPQPEPCSGWTAFFTAFIKARKPSPAFLDPKQLLELVVIDPKESSVDILLWQLRALRGLANLGHDISVHLSRAELLQINDPVVRMELVRLIRASSRSIEGASWWLEDQDTLTLVRQAVLTGAREEGLRIWCSWLDHGLGLDEDVDCFLPEVMRIAHSVPPRLQCVILRYLRKVNLFSVGEQEVHRWLVPASQSTCITTGAPFVREAIASLVETTWTFRPLRRLRALVEPIWPSTQWPAEKAWAVDALDTPNDALWGIFPGAPMAPCVPDGWVDYVLQVDEAQVAGRDLPCVAPLWEVGLRKGTAALGSVRVAKEARNIALESGIDLPVELWQPCEDWCSAQLAPFLAVREASAEAMTALLDQIPKLEAPHSVVFLTLCVATELFSDNDDMLAAIDRLLVLPSMPMGGMPFPTAFGNRLVELFDVLMQRFADEGVCHPTLVRLLVCFAAQWAPVEVRRKFWLADPHFPILLCHHWTNAGMKLVGNQEAYKEIDDEICQHLDPYLEHAQSTAMPLAAIL